MTLQELLMKILEIACWVLVAGYSLFSLYLFWLSRHIVFLAIAAILIASACGFGAIPTYLVALAVSIVTFAAILMHESKLPMSQSVG